MPIACSSTGAQRTTAEGGTSAAGGALIGGAGGSSAAGASAGVTSAGGASAGATNASGASAGGASSGGVSSGGASSGGTSAGGTSAAGASIGGSAGAATLADVQAIFDAHCVNCHDKSKGGLPTYPSLSLVAGDAKAYLVNKPALETCGGLFVVPGAPDQSYLVHKVSDASPCEGEQMPRPFEIIKPPPLSASEIATIRSWISAGAQ